MKDKFEDHFQIPKNTPKEYINLLQDSRDGKNVSPDYLDQSEIDKAVNQGKSFFFGCEVNENDQWILKIGKIALIIVFICLILLLIFGDIKDPMFLLLGLAPLFMMGVIAYGYYNEGQNRIKNKPSWYLIVGPKGMFIKNRDIFDYFEWFQISALAEHIKKKRNVDLDIFGTIFVARQQQHTLEFFVYNLKNINQNDPDGKIGRANLMYIIKKYIEKSKK